MVTQHDIDSWTLHDLRYCLGRTIEGVAELQEAVSAAREVSG